MGIIGNDMNEIRIMGKFLGNAGGIISKLLSILGSGLSWHTTYTSIALSDLTHQLTLFTEAQKEVKVNLIEGTNTLYLYSYIHKDNCVIANKESIANYQKPVLQEETL